jgi:hypothetical protein
MFTKGIYKNEVQCKVKIKIENVNEFREKITL